MGQPNRKFSLGTSYRYGFNGKENDNEVKGEGNQQDYGMRIYDPRLGRFLSVDPISKSYPMLTPYQFASNRPIDGIDLDGKEWSKSEPYFLSPVGKYVVDYKVVLNVSSTSNWKAANSKNDLDGIAKVASGILSNTNAAGTTDDPIVNVKISFIDNDRGSFKFSMVTSTIRVNQNTGDPNLQSQTIWSDGTTFDGPVKATGATETVGNILENKVTLIYNTDLINAKNGQAFGRPINISGIPTTQKLGRSLAHELGHTLGLNHPWQTEQEGADNNDISNLQGLGPIGKPSNVNNNLMNSEGNPIGGFQTNEGTQLTDNQRGKINKKLDEAKAPATN